MFLILYLILYFVCAISLMCRFYQLLCILFSTQKNNSIDRMFTNIIFNDAPPAPATQYPPPLLPFQNIYFRVTSFAFAFEIIPIQILLLPRAVDRTLTYLSVLSWGTSLIFHQNHNLAAMWPTTLLNKTKHNKLTS